MSPKHGAANTSISNAMNLRVTQIDGYSTIYDLESPERDFETKNLTVNAKSMSSRNNFDPIHHPN